MDTQEDHAVELAGSRSLTATFSSHHTTARDKDAHLEQMSRLMPFLSDFVFFSEAYERGAGHGVLPAGTIAKPLRSGKGGPLFQRTTSRNLFVLENHLESPLEVIVAAKRFVERMD
jgi:hypothetical protein